MSDFHQSGPVTALPRLVDRPVGDLESQILRRSRRFPVALVIPMVPAEMDRRASIDAFLTDPLGAPLVANWARVFSGMPDAAARLLAAVQLGASVPAGSVA